MRTWTLCPWIQRKRRFPKGLNASTYDVPRAFQIPDYAEAQHQELAVMIRVDEEYYGWADGFDGHNFYNESMLSQQGLQHQYL